MKCLVSIVLLLCLTGLSGCGKTHRLVGPAPNTINSFNEMDWVQGQFFLLYDPNLGAVYDADLPSLRVYRDDGDFTNNLNTIAGKAVLDPDGAMAMTLTPEQSTASVSGQFDLLVPGPGADYEILGDVYTFQDTVYHVLRLRAPIQRRSIQTLAVSYDARPVVGPGHALGAPIAVGGRRLVTPGPDSGAVLLKLLRVPRNRERPAPDFLHLDPDAPLAPARELELKNVYSLGAFGIDPRSFTLAVEWGQASPSVESFNGITFLEMLGLDSWDERSGLPVPGHDGRVDSSGLNSQSRPRIDYERGLLFLPDLRPFAPRLNGGGARTFDRYLDAHVNRRLHIADTAPLGDPGLDPYELFSPQPQDARWFMTAEFQAPPPSAEASLRH